MIEEVWRDVKGYEGLYQVSDQGHVKSLERTFIDKIGRERYVKECILKPVIDRYGYLLVSLYAGGKQKMLRVHRLVCEAFHENHDDKPYVNHINENKADNRALNLEWCTAKENCNHGTRNERSAKKRSKQVGQYTPNGELVKVWQSNMEAERQAGFSNSHVSQVANGKRKTAYGFIWEYVDEVVE